jgi:hypothetical protein
MRVDTELALEVYQKDESPQPDWTVQSNATFLSCVETGDFKASLEGAPLDNDQLTLKGTVVTGRNEEPDDYNASKLAAGGRIRPLPLPSLSPGCGGDV